MVDFIGKTGIVLSVDLSSQPGFAYRRYRRFFRNPLRISGAEFPCREGIVIRLELGGGKVGWGEAAPWQLFTGERLEAVERVFCSWGEALPLDWKTQLSGLPSAHVAVESALDWLTSEECPEREGTIRTAALLSAGDRALGEVEPLMEQGYKVFKWKIGVESPEQERKIARQLFQQLHARGILRLDANGGLNEEEAESWLRFLAEFPVDFLEQPLPKGAEATMERFALRYKVAVALDESANLAAHYRGGPLVIKPSWLGHLHAWRIWRREHPELRVIYSSAFETGIGMETILRLAGEDHARTDTHGLGTNEWFGEDGLSWHGNGPLLRFGGESQIQAEAVWDRLKP